VCVCVCVIMIRSSLENYDLSLNDITRNIKQNNRKEIHKSAAMESIAFFENFLKKII
jgi:hypothetical protein